MIENNNEIVDGIEKSMVARTNANKGSLFEGRFSFYDKFNFTVRILDILIISATVLLFVAFVLGASI